MVNGLHLYSAFIQSTLQFMPLIHPFTHTFTHQRRLTAMQGPNQLIRSNWGLGILLRDTSTRPGWDRTCNPLTARRQVLPPEPHRHHIRWWISRVAAPSPDVELQTSKKSYSVFSSCNETYNFSSLYRMPTHLNSCCSDPLQLSSTRRPGLSARNRLGVFSMTQGTVLDFPGSSGRTVGARLNIIILHLENYGDNILSAKEGAFWTPGLVLHDSLT